MSLASILVMLNKKHREKIGDRPPLKKKGQTTINDKYEKNRGQTTINSNYLRAPIFVINGGLSPIFPGPPYLSLMVVCPLFFLSPIFPGLFATDERKRTASFSIPVWALPDGLLVSTGNPRNLSGYKSIAEQQDCTLAVIRDQFQHRSAVEFGVPENRLHIFETYIEAANAVLTGIVDAYASVGRAHTGYIDLYNERRLEFVTVPTTEKQPAFGSFAFSRQDNDLREGVNRVLRSYYGTGPHRKMMHSFGFDDAEIDLVIDSYE